MCQSKIKRFELVELTVPANATGRVTFNTIPQLRNQSNQNIYIKRIAVFLDTVYAFSQTTNSIPGMAAAELPKAVLVLYVNGEESVHMIPLAQLNHINDAASPFQQDAIEFDDLTNVDFDKSYVQFNQPAAAAQYVIPFGITYLRIIPGQTAPYNNL